MIRVFQVWWLALAASACAAEDSGDAVADLAPPVVEVQAPREADAFHQGEPIDLVGSVFDALDAPGDLLVTWTLDGEEVLDTEVAADGTATGEIDTTALDARTHILRLQAVDLDGATAYEHVGISIVGPEGAPDVDIVTAKKAIEVSLGDTLTLTADVSDAATPAELLSFEWSSDIDGSLGDGVVAAGTATLVTDSLTVGTHAITLDVTDGDGEVGEDSIAVTVIEPVPESACGRLGQTFVYATDFDSGIPTEFSGPANAVGVEGWDGLGFGDFVFSGEMAQNTTVPPRPLRLELDGLPAHSSISVAFLFAMIDSWDGNNWGAGPDSFEVFVDDEPVFAEVFVACCGTTDYLPPAGAVLSSGTQLGFNSLPDMSHDAAYDMTLEPAFRDIPHTASSVLVEWTAAGAAWQGGTDESWAIDALCISVAE